MKKFALAAGVLVALAAVPALAQPAGSFRGPAQPLTRADVQARTQAQFARADTDRDGFVTQAEAEARAEVARADRRERRAERLGNRGERRARVFARLDANGDGMISRAEFDARAAQRGDRAERRGFRAERRAARMERRGQRGGFAALGQRRFENTDADRDGRISLAEAQARALARFERLDADRDGRVTREERLRAREERRGRRDRG